MREEKILVTGLTGQIAFPMAVHLAEHNEVWGAARFTAEGSRQRVSDAGITPITCDLASGDFRELPDDFTYVLHLAAFQGAEPDYDWALTVNAEGTGLLMQHCAAARGFLVASTFSVYDPNPDPDHRYTETDPLGDCHALHSPTYSVAKIGQEAVARTMSRALGLPTTIARINAAYSSHGGLPAYHLDWLMADSPITLRGSAPTPYSVIHQNDMNVQAESLLAAATSPATIVNWCGDEPIAAEDWIAFLSDLTGKTAQIAYADHPGTPPGAAGDAVRRRSITGPCQVKWQAGFTELWEHRYPGGTRAADVFGGAGNLKTASEQPDT
jgi:nucleoside-diphosphate-sugar epimerase